MEMNLFKEYTLLVINYKQKKKDISVHLQANGISKYTTLQYNDQIWFIKLLFHKLQIST